MTKLLRSQTTSRAAASALACAVLALGVAAAVLARADYDEYKVKAAFLLNFARLVEWPAAVGPKQGQALVVCVHGEEASTADALRALDGVTVEEHPVEVRALDSPSELNGCHILFLADVRNADAPAWIAGSQRRSVLSVGEAPGFAGRGGVINFFVEGKKLRFEINKDAADRSGLKISSRLLRLARLVPDAN